MVRTIPVSDELHNKIREKIIDIERKYGIKRVVTMKEFVDLFFNKNLSNDDEYFKDLVK